VDRRNGSRRNRRTRNGAPTVTLAGVQGITSQFTLAATANGNTALGTPESCAAHATARPHVKSLIELPRQFSYRWWLLYPARAQDHLVISHGTASAAARASEAVSERVG